MDDLAEEVLEIIFSYLSPYREYEIASCVCRKWKRILYGLLQKLPSKFEKDIVNGNIQWFIVEEGDQITSLSQRLNQATCYSDYSRAMYVFGGKSIRNSSTGFNDLLSLDLHSFLWKRPAAKGQIPPPKYGCTLDSYKNYLILFGGSSLTPSNSLGRGTSEYYNTLHIYNIKTETWTLKSFLPEECPDELYLPKTCLIADHVDPELDVLMVYGGKKKVSGQQVNNSDVWCLDLNSWIWIKQTLIWEENSISVLNDSSVNFYNFKTTLYSSSLFILGPRALSSWLMYKTGFAEWTLKKLKMSTENSSLLFSGYSHLPSMIMGHSFICFGINPPGNFSPSERIRRPITLHASCKRKNNLPITLQHNRFLSFITMLDLSEVETEGVVKNVNQLDNENDKPLPSFFGVGVNSTSTAVIGRGEIILHSLDNTRRDLPFSLQIIRSKH